MSEHRAVVEWQRNGQSFEYERYPRDHRVRFDNGLSVCASAAPDFFGSTDCVDPEEALVGALASCHMLTFLAVCCKKGFVVNSYQDDAVGQLGKNGDGRMAVTLITLRPAASFEGRAPTAEELAQLHERAHAGCFIGNSIRSEVRVEPRLA